MWALPGACLFLHSSGIFAQTASGHLLELMPIDPSFSPPGESAADLWIERSNLDGVNLACVAYGVLFALFVQCARHLLHNPKEGKIKWWFVAYLFTVLSLGTVGIGSQLKFNQMAYVDHRNIPGGPNAFMQAFSSHWIRLLGNSAWVGMSWVGNGFVIWRLAVIWSYSVPMLVVPGLIYLGSIATSLIHLYTITLPPSPTTHISQFFSSNSHTFTAAHYATTVGLSLILTILILTRLLLTRSRVQHALGERHARTYTCAQSMVVESAALSAVWGVVFIVPWAMGRTGVWGLVGQVLGPVQGISPLLILIRIARGRAWSRHTLSATSRSFTSSSFSGTIPLSIPRPKVDYPTSLSHLTDHLSVRNSSNGDNSVHTFNLPIVGRGIPLGMPSFRVSTPPSLEKDLGRAGSYYSVNYDWEFGAVQKEGYAI